MKSLPLPEIPAEALSANDEAFDRSSRLVQKVEELVVELYNEPIGVAPDCRTA